MFTQYYKQENFEKMRLFGEAILVANYKLLTHIAKTQKNAKKTISEYEKYKEILTLLLNIIQFDRKRNCHYEANLQKLLGRYVRAILLDNKPETTTPDLKSSIEESLIEKHGFYTSKLIDFNELLFKTFEGKRENFLKDETLRQLLIQVLVILEKGEDYIKLFLTQCTDMLSNVCRWDTSFDDPSEEATRLLRFILDLDNAMFSLYPHLKKTHESVSHQVHADAKLDTKAEAKSDVPPLVAPNSLFFPKPSEKPKDFLEGNRYAALVLLKLYEDQYPKSDIDIVREKIINEKNPDAMRELFHELINVQTKGLEAVLPIKVKIDNDCRIA